MKLMNLLTKARNVMCEGVWLAIVMYDHARHGAWSLTANWLFLPLRERLKERHGFLMWWTPNNRIEAEKEGMAYEDARQLYRQMASAHEKRLAERRQSARSVSGNA